MRARYTGEALHLAMARRYLREDRLELAASAMQQAMRAGLPPSDLYDLQRTIDAELGTRRVSRMQRVEEHLIVEAPGDWRNESMAALCGLAGSIGQEVGLRLKVRWGKPVLLTLIPSEEWVSFMHARYGYYMERAESHKVCLPPSGYASPQQLARALRHEVAHAAVHQHAGSAAPRWLDEGIAVALEGGAHPRERRSYALAVARHGRMRLDEIGGALESYGTALNSEHAALCYAAAGDFVAGLVERSGYEGLVSVLRGLGSGTAIDRCIRVTYGRSLRSIEAEWRSSPVAADMV